MRLSPTTWLERERAHHERADALTAEHRARASRRETHPVWDFLFTYYSYKPAQLRRWHPGAGVELEDAGERRTWRWYSPGTTPDGAVPDAAGFAAEKPELAGLVERMLRRTASRPGQFGCFGLHEWAMVYRADEHRHAVPLRLGQAGTDLVMESHELRCTHFDAFRFFTPDAVPRNRTPLTRDDQPLFEQPGCLHAGMDLYKWALKLGPSFPVSCCSMRSNWPVTSACSTWRPPRTTSAPGVSCRCRSRRPRGRPSTCAVSGGSRSAGRHCVRGCSNRGSEQMP